MNMKFKMALVKSKRFILELTNVEEAKNEKKQKIEISPDIITTVSFGK